MLVSLFRGSRLRAALTAGLVVLTANAALTLAPAPPAAAQSAAARAAVDAAKANGTVGEQADGFLGFVRPSTDPALAAAVAEINAGRAQLYREVAQRTGVTPEAAGQATAQQLFARLPQGHYFRTLEGTWTRK